MRWLFSALSKLFVAALVFPSRAGMITSEPNNKRLKLVYLCVTAFIVSTRCGSEQFRPDFSADH